jgi:hypothetical protein
LTFSDPFIPMQVSDGPHGCSADTFSRACLGCGVRYATYGRAFTESGAQLAYLLPAGATR